MPIFDELGFVPLSKTGAELLFEIFSQRYERGSIEAMVDAVGPRAPPVDYGDKPQTPSGPIITPPIGRFLLRR